MSGGARGFIEARARYSATLAAVSAAGYVAGVGDRHLQNFLMDTGTGNGCYEIPQGNLSTSAFSGHSSSFP